MVRDAHVPAGAVREMHAVGVRVTPAQTTPKRHPRPRNPALTMNKGTPMYQAPELREGASTAKLMQQQSKPQGGDRRSVPTSDSHGGHARRVEHAEADADWSRTRQLPLCFAPLPPAALAGLLGVSLDTMTRLGVPTGTAPSLPSLPYNTSADIFAFSCFLWELLTGGRPFLPFPGAESRPGFRSLVTTLSGELHARPPIPPSAPTAYAHLMRCGWHPVPERRPTAAVFAEVLRRLLAAAEIAVTRSDVDLELSAPATPTAQQPAPSGDTASRAPLLVLEPQASSLSTDGPSVPGGGVVWRGWSGEDASMRAGTEEPLRIVIGPAAASRLVVMRPPTSRDAATDSLTTPMGSSLLTSPWDPQLHASPPDPAHQASSSALEGASECHVAIRAAELSRDSRGSLAVSEASESAALDEVDSRSAPLASAAASRRQRGLSSGSGFHPHRSVSMDNDAILARLVDMPLVSQRGFESGGSIFAEPTDLPDGLANRTADAGDPFWQELAQ
jgi:serine/threonine protein kinase